MRKINDIVKDLERCRKCYVGFLPDPCPTCPYEEECSPSGSTPEHRVKMFEQELLKTVYARITEVIALEQLDVFCEKAKAGRVVITPSIGEDNYEGLKLKYFVFNAKNNLPVDNCFVLRPDKDPAAVAALLAYAEKTDNKVLTSDIFSWLGLDENKTVYEVVEEYCPCMTPPIDYHHVEPTTFSLDMLAGLGSVYFLNKEDAERAASEYNESKEDSEEVYYDMHEEVDE